MGQTTSTSSPSPSSSLEAKSAQCSVQHSPLPPSQNPAPKCPVDHNPLASSSTSASGSGSTPSPRPSSLVKCPIDHEKSETLNPLNQMPTLAQERAPGQEAELPLDREVSSIPRASDSSKWEYPSAQQFYNALVRKGWETPEEHVQTMVDIHNFLNEEAWQEILKWEPPSYLLALARNSDPYLAKFKGKPGQLSPKARVLMFAGWLLPSRFNTEPPFDRHDWIVHRPQTGEEVRYIIDYYSAPPLPDGSPVFSLDVRPALDSVAGVQARVSGWKGVWADATTRENKA
ncbi:cytochrome c heme lyase [Thelephora terrestris]|uniref:Holocytochrome c-type synthase n=1 Tax=Thelephora terrestris TaxID=56493 RepID=A0A9P6H2A7_9AGAM|nr:cytochrome c heme lyase [Thelephora terrestris]